jgi:hypothetical protein
MKRIGIVALLSAVLCLGVGASSAEASFANCSSFSCVNKKLNKLNFRLRQVENALSCEGEAPLSSYGDFDTNTFGYRWEDPAVPESFLTSALDFASIGEVPDIWAIYDACADGIPAKAGVSAGALGPRSYDLRPEAPHHRAP